MDNGEFDIAGSEQVDSDGDNNFILDAGGDLFDSFNHENIGDNGHGHG